MSIHQETPAARLVDLLEFKAIVHEYREVPLETLLDAIGIAEDTPADAFEEEDPEDANAKMNEDTARENVCARVEREVERRMESLKRAYPFEFADGVLRFHLDLATPGQLAYLLCLRLSIPLSDVLEEEKLPGVDTRIERNLFQHCANLAAAGYLDGKVYAFGWPRPDNTGLLAALRKVEEAMGEGEVVSEIPDWAPTNPKDDELDVVAWIPHVDGPGCALTLWGQVASGKNWTDKAFSSDRIERFQRRWYQQAPVFHPIRAMFVPFSLFDDIHDRDQGLYIQKLKDHACEFGIIFHRYRLPACVQRAFDRGREVSVMTGLASPEVARQLQIWWEGFEAELRRGA